MAMGKYMAALGIVAAVMLLVFFAVEAAGVPLLSDPSPWLARGGWLAAATGVGLLLIDVVAPVPSSLVMVAHGAIFGPWLGTLLSLAGGLGAAAVAGWLGHRGGPLLGRFISPDERARAQGLIDRWGPLAVIVTRPIPILAESVAILAGASGIGWAKLLVSAAAGLLPPAAFYAIAGAAAAGFGSTVIIFSLSLAVAGLFWWAGRAWTARRRQAGAEHEAAAAEPE